MLRDRNRDERRERQWILRERWRSHRYRAEPVFDEWRGGRLSEREQQLGDG